MKQIITPQYAYPVPGIRDACLKELARCARIFSRLGARVMNIHPCYFCPPAMRDQLVSFQNTITLEIFCNDPQMQVAYWDLSRDMVRRLWY
ncbi:hypothetical protein [Desulfobacter latus]|uniref:hypothetical protein n=1 Tax=Desulfobacter latus TaxID=2292 RepID=UPI001FE93EC5|nr:hypothetical protein [Desulfobacter latus]